MTADELRERIRSLVAEYHAAAFPQRPFFAGNTPVPVAGRVFGPEEVQSLVDASLDFWLTTGRFADQFEAGLAKTVGVRSALLVNSGSSANLVAVSALTSPVLGERRLKPGDEVITAAAGFPTTVNPIVQNGAVPVFLDADIATHNADLSQLEAALSSKTRAVILAHTLGNPFDAKRVREFCDAHGLWMVEDCCDALGATVGGKNVGTFGDLATLSFYPAHHLTTGEGGCVLTDRPALKKSAESFRDWGRDCWCAPGRDNTCGKRFDWQLGELPCGYDHKYVYSHIGYNLKMTDMQAAVGVAQLARLPEFVAARRANHARLLAALRGMEDDLMLPEPTPGTEPSWFGFAINVRPGRGIERNALVRHLESRKVATRLLFAGNLVRQPAYRDVAWRAVDALPRADFVMENTFWVGVYPGLTAEMIDFTAATIREGLAAVRGGEGTR